jgi:hypothetical protein
MPRLHILLAMIATISLFAACNRQKNESRAIGLTANTTVNLNAVNPRPLLSQASRRKNSWI